MGMLLPVALVVGIGSLICWILVIVKIFQSGAIGLGICAIICPLFAFIYGWVKVDEFGIKNVMIAWSVCILLNLVMNFAMMGSGQMPAR